MSSRQFSRLRKRSRKVSVHNKSDISVSKASREQLIFCHLCNINVHNYEEFRMHIMKKHRPSSRFYEGNSDDSSHPATDIQDSQESGLKCKREICSDEEDDLGENEENTDFDYDAKIYDQSLYNNISETAVYPQSLSYGRSKNKKTPPKTKFSLSKVKKESENSTDHSSMNNVVAIPSSVNHITPQMISFANNQFNPHLNPMLNNSQFVLNNNQLQLISPYNQQTSYLMGNQPALQFNPVVVSPVSSQNGFAFNAKNIIKWNYKFKKMAKTLKYPLKKRLLKKVQSVYEDIYHNCYFLGVQTDIEKAALLQIYADLALMICKHNELVHEPI